MITSNLFLNNDDIQKKVKECAQWIDLTVGHNNNYTICPILQSSYYFAADVSRCITTVPQFDFFGVQRYVDDGAEELYVYKGVDPSLVDSKTVILLDVLVNSGTTMSMASKMLYQIGARKVYTISLMCRQFVKFKTDWTGIVISDESVYGYGLDFHNKNRTLKEIYYE